MITLPASPTNLIADIYDAAIEPALWQNVLATLSQNLHSQYAVILFGDRLNPREFITYNHGPTPEMMERYFDGNFSGLDMHYALEWTRRGIPVGTAEANHVVFGNIENFKRVCDDLYTNFYEKNRCALPTCFST